jgi:hypothetical protein
MAALISKKHLARRTFLRGVGATIALPFLDSMVAAQTPLSATPAMPKPRFLGIYVPHGATMSRWTPAGEGTGFGFSEILEPLEGFRDRINVVSNLYHPAAASPESDANADHARSAPVYLSGALPNENEPGSMVTLDQLLAERIGQDTPLPSLELAIENVALSCPGGYGCAFLNTISWHNGTPLPMENSPQVVFERLFGDGSNAELRLRRKQEDRSILDSVVDKVASLQSTLDAGDRARLTEYLDNIREIERRIELAEQQTAGVEDIPEAPVGIPESFDAHLKLMFDLQLLAWRAEITRVATLMYGKDLSATSYPESGVRDGFHGASHHSNDPARMATFALINRYHVSMLAYFLQKLRDTPDGDGNLLDNSVVLYGSSMSNGNEHNHDPLPVLVAGGAGGRLQGGRHIVTPPQTPMSNLLLALLDTLGVPESRFGDSTAKLDI